MRDPNLSTPPNSVPNTADPLVITPTPPAVGGPIKNGLGQLIHLVGNWHSIPAGTYSWNVMPLPQDNVKYNFILKNFPYLEELTFAEIPGTAPNRGGGFTQIANTLFYEQRVYFSPTPTAVFPAPDSVPSGSEYTLVHAENGSWLFLDNNYQFPGAFQPDPVKPVPLPDGTTSLPPQDQSINIAKQMSVPHGNSILAVGTVTPNAVFPPYPPEDKVLSPNNPGAPSLPTTQGAPTIPQVNTIPVYQGVPYGADLYGAPVPVNGIETNSDINPNIKLVDYLKAFPTSEYIHFKVSSNNITNIQFESKHAKVVSYEMDMWLLNPNGPNKALMYSQNIGMDLTLSSSTNTETIKVTFPHITCNVVTLV